MVSPENPRAHGPADVPTRGEPALAAARRQRVELLFTIHQFEHALAVPAGSPDWREQVSGRLAALREAVTEHVVVTEGPDGLYHELLDQAPRLCRGVELLTREHGALVAAVDALRLRLAEPAVTVERVRGWGDDLLRGLFRHRQRGADLVYEAYATDIGGET